MAVPPVLIKAAAAAASDKRTYKVLGTVLTALLMPVLFLIFLVIVLVTGVTEANYTMLDYVFSDIALPGSVTQEQCKVIENMRFQLRELDEAMNEDETGSFDYDLVRAAFYCLKFGTEPKTDGEGAEMLFDYPLFIDCFRNISIEEIDIALQNVSERFPETEIKEKHITAIKMVCSCLKERFRL